MNIREFAKEVTAIMPYIHVELVKRQPDILIKGKITFPQMVILDILRIRKECKMGDISRALGVTKSAVTGLTNRLIKTGLVTRSRSQTDRRVVRIKLTSRGNELSKRLINFKLKITTQLFANISQKERMQYLGILRKLRQNIRKKMEYKVYG